jgi:hypothetical protein
MTRNVGSLDRLVRIMIGVALLSLLYLLPGDEKWFGLIGLLPLGTALISWCPLYTALGFRT